MRFLLLSVSLAFSCVSTIAWSAGPLRIGYLKVNAARDSEKPLAALDSAGFAINSGVLVGSYDDHWTVGISLASLKPVWWSEQPSTATTPPGSFGSSVVMGYRSGQVVKFDAVSGKQLWTQSLDSFSDRPMALHSNTLYVVTSAQVLYAIDFQSGRILWVFDGGFPDGLVIRSGVRPVVYEGKVLFGLASGEIVAVAADQGKLLWRYNPAYNDSRFHAVVGEMAVINGKLVIARYDGIVAAIDLASSVRQVSWQERFPVLTYSLQRGDRYFVGASNGDVIAIDPNSSGRKIWTASTGASVTTMVAGESALYVTGKGGQVTALDWRDGSVAWADQLGSSIATPPMIHEDTLFVPTAFTSIYGFRLKGSG